MPQQPQRYLLFDVRFRADGGSLPAFVKQEFDDYLDFEPGALSCA